MDKFSLSVNETVMKNRLSSEVKINETSESDISRSVISVWLYALNMINPVAPGILV